MGREIQNIDITTYPYMPCLHFFTVVLSKHALRIHLKTCCKEVNFLLIEPFLLFHAKLKDFLGYQSSFTSCNPSYIFTYLAYLSMRKWKIANVKSGKQVNSFSR